MNEQSYIIRIYRSAIRLGTECCSHDAIALDGIVEFPASGERQAFHDAEELWGILAENALSETIPKRSAKPHSKR